jgi:hypothetical protein
MFIAQATAKVGTISPTKKHVTIVNDDFRVINKLEASLTNDARVVIYDRHMFIAQVTAKVGTISPTTKNI